MFEKGHAVPNDPSQNSGCLFALFGGGQAQQRKNEENALPYRVRDDFLTPPEASLCHVVTSVLGSQAVVCPKVRLGDIFFVHKGENRMSHANRINAKHVDFLLCEPQTLKPLAGIELDDASHQRPDRRERDAFVDKVFKSAGLPLFHIKTQATYKPSNIAGLLRPLLGQQDQQKAMDKQDGPPPPPTPPRPADAPICPKCAVKMVLRTARRAPHKGRVFYGCPNYPKCRHVVPMD